MMFIVSYCGNDISEVIYVMKKYSNLEELIANDESAKRFFSSLPSYVKEQITMRSDSVNSLDSLRTYSDNLLQGDD